MRSLKVLLVLKRPNFEVNRSMGSRRGLMATSERSKNRAWKQKFPSYPYVIKTSNTKFKTIILSIQHLIFENKDAESLAGDRVWGKGSASYYLESLKALGAGALICF